MAGAGVGHSRIEDSFQAGRAAAEQAMAQARGTPKVAIVYATVLYEQQALLRGVRAALGPGVPIVGSSSQGISRPGGVDEVDRVAGVAVISAEGVTAQAVVARDLAADPLAAGRAIASAVGPEGPGDGPLFVWYDPITGANIQALLDGLAAGGRSNVLGGGAGQPWGPIHRSYQYCGDEVLRDAVVALKLQGLSVVHDLTHGTEPLGLELTVTASDGNAIREIDGVPAHQLWAEQLGGGRPNNVEETAGLALGVHLPDGATHEGHLSRAVFGYRAETGELLLQVPIPTGTRVQLCHRTPHAVHDRAIEMAQRLAERLRGEQPLLALSFECGARPRPFLGDDGALAEVRAMQRVLGPELPWLGFYAWGELAPVGARTRFHNYTFPLAVLVARGAEG